MATERTGAGCLAAILAFGLSAMSPAPSDGPVRLSTMNLHETGRQDLVGYPVYDRFGVEVGEVLSVEADHRGRTRILRLSLQEGGDVSLASYNVWIHDRRVLTHQARDLLKARATIAPEQ